MRPTCTECGGFTRSAAGHSRERCKFVKAQRSFDDAVAAMEERLWVRAGSAGRLLRDLGCPVEYLESPYQNTVVTVGYAPAWAVLAADLRKEGSQREKLFPIERRKWLVCTLLRSEVEQARIGGLVRLSGLDVARDAMRQMIHVVRKARMR